jgi:RNA polymerase sigma factor (sigma-70 family)
MPEDSENPPKVSLPSAVGTDSPTPPTAKTLPLNRERFITKALADFESPLIGYASTILNDIDRARDVVQDTFLKLCQQDLAKVEDHLKSWLFTVTRNGAFDILRKEKHTQPLEDIRWKKVAGPDLQPDEVADSRERMVRLMEYMHRLTDNQREVIMLKFQQRLSYQDIQKITGLSASNIGFLIHTGLRRLREILPADL